MSRLSPVHTERACTACSGGFLGVFIGFFCPLCVPSSAAVLTGIGLAFLPQRPVIFSLIAVAAVIFLLSLASGIRRHGDISPMLFGALGVISVPLGRYILGSAVLTYGGAFCVIAASLWNMWLPTRKENAQSMGSDSLEQLLRITNA
jgi:hypothetical protein